MFKKIIITCMLTTALLTLSACGKNSKYCGLYRAETAQYMDTEVYAVELLQGEFKVDLQKSGKAIVSILGKEQIGKWEETKKKITVKADDTFVFTKKDKALTYTYKKIPLVFLPFKAEK